jgi:lipopolysaccharide biosynthesis glycosyltransferase
MYHIVLSSNERYMPGAIVALSSVAVNAKPDTELCFHVFTENVKRETIKFLELTIKRLHTKSIVKEHVCDETILNGLPEYAGSRMSWVRCFYSRILNDVDWALYLDCDVLYLASPEEHFSYKDDSVYACVTRDMSPTAPTEDKVWAYKECGVDLDIDHYFNAGVMLFNFKKFREDNIPEKIADFIQLHPKTLYADQTAMNILFNGKNIKFIPDKFDMLQIYLDDKALLEKPVIHYVSGIPWLPKLSVVANGRFRLWHKFADKYVWEKEGESYRRLFLKNIIIFKNLFNAILKTPLLGRVFSNTLSMFGRVNNAKGWRESQTLFDVSSNAIRKILSGK